MGGQPGALQVSLRVVAVLVMIVALLCGMMPIRQALRSSQRDALYEGGHSVLGASRSRWGKIALLGTQLGLCFVVLVGSALLLRTMLNVLNRARGFDRDNVMTAQISLSRSGYSKEKGLAFDAALLEELRSSPVVRGATLTSHLPHYGHSAGAGPRIHGAGPRGSAAGGGGE